MSWCLQALVNMGSCACGSGPKACSSWAPCLLGWWGEVTLQMMGVGGEARNYVHGLTALSQSLFPCWPVARHSKLAYVHTFLFWWPSDTHHIHYLPSFWTLWDCHKRHYHFLSQWKSCSLRIGEPILIWLPPSLSHNLFVSWYQVNESEVEPGGRETKDTHARWREEGLCSPVHWPSRRCLTLCASSVVFSTTPWTKCGPSMLHTQGLIHKCVSVCDHTAGWEADLGCEAGLSDSRLSISFQYSSVIFPKTLLIAFLF